MEAPLGGDGFPIVSFSYLFTRSFSFTFFSPLYVNAHLETSQLISPAARLPFLVISLTIRLIFSLCHLTSAITSLSKASTTALASSPPCRLASLILIMSAACRASYSARSKRRLTAGSQLAQESSR